MHIFDAHLDLALNGVDWNRDLRQTVDDIRAQEQGLGMNQAGRGTNTVSLPELRRAGVKTCVATLLARQEIPINHEFATLIKDREDNVTASLVNNGLVPLTISAYDLFSKGITSLEEVYPILLNSI